MELLNQRLSAPPLPSATVVLLRDGDAGLEVFLLQRHAASDVLGGAYVFPGGKVDAEDAEWLAHLDTAPATLHARLGEPELAEAEAATLFVSAARELFEETGVLLGDVAPAAARAAWSALREGPRFAELLLPAGMRLLAGTLQPWSRWVTPVLASVSRKRFDTRFFVARVPEGQVAGHDRHEAIASLWLSPRAALAQYWDGAIDLAPPQILSLAHLARHGSVDGVLAAAAKQPPPCIRPQPFDVEGERILCYPGDPWHDVREQLLPGPTRLRWRNRRFEPEGGLPALLGD